MHTTITLLPLSASLYTQHSTATYHLHSAAYNRQSFRPINPAQSPRHCGPFFQLGSQLTGSFMSRQLISKYSVGSASWKMFYVTRLNIFFHRRMLTNCFNTCSSVSIKHPSLIDAKHWSRITRFIVLTYRLFAKYITPGNCRWNVRRNLL